MSSTLRGIDIHTYLVGRAGACDRVLARQDGARPLVGVGERRRVPLAGRFDVRSLEMDDGSWTAGNGIMFAVDDVAAAAEELRAKGVAVAEYIEESPVCFMGFATDSEGNGFILHHRKT